MDQKYGLNKAGIWLENPAEIHLPRRGFFKLTAASAAAFAASVSPPAKANPALRFVASVFLGWAIEKFLDEVWDSATKRREIARYIHGEPVWETTSHTSKADVTVRFSGRDLEAAESPSSSFRDVPVEIITAAYLLSGAPDNPLLKWGAPTSDSYTSDRELAGGGTLKGLWWNNNLGGKSARYVAVRWWPNGRAEYLSFVNDSAREAERVLEGDDTPLRPGNLKTLRRWIYG